MNNNPVTILEYVQENGICVKPNILSQDIQFNKIIIGDKTYRISEYNIDNEDRQNCLVIAKVVSILILIIFIIILGIIVFEK